MPTDRANPMSPRSRDRDPIHDRSSGVVGFRTLQGACRFRGGALSSAMLVSRRIRLRSGVRAASSEPDRITVKDSMSENALAKGRVES